MSDDTFSLSNAASTFLTFQKPEIKDRTILKFIENPFENSISSTGNKITEHGCFSGFKSNYEGRIKTNSEYRAIVGWRSLHKEYRKVLEEIQDLFKYVEIEVLNEIPIISHKKDGWGEIKYSITSDRDKAENFSVFLSIYPTKDYDISRRSRVAYLVHHLIRFLSKPEGFVKNTVKDLNLEKITTIQNKFCGTGEGYRSLSEIPIDLEDIIATTIPENVNKSGGGFFGCQTSVIYYPSRIHKFGEKYFKKRVRTRVPIVRTNTYSNCTTLGVYLSAMEGSDLLSSNYRRDLESIIYYEVHDKKLRTDKKKLETVIEKSKETNINRTKPEHKINPSGTMIMRCKDAIDKYALIGANIEEFIDISIDTFSKMLGRKVRID